MGTIRVFILQSKSIGNSNNQPHKSKTKGGYFKLKKTFIIGLTAGIITLGLFSGCGQQAQPQLTKEQKQAIQMQEVAKENQKIQAEIDKKLASILEKGKSTVKQVTGTSPFGEKETQWQYTFLNDSKYSFDWIQLNWDEFAKDGSKEGSNCTDPIKNIKSGQTFTANVRLSAGTSGKGVASYKLTKLTGNPVSGTFKELPK